MRDYKYSSEPFLMQKLAVYQLKRKRHYGNWCGTGAGKTNSALIATRETNSRVSVIICPNSVKETWINSIKDVYPDNTDIVEYATISQIKKFDRNRFTYIIINYDKFSIDTKNHGKEMVDKLLFLNTIDFICIDEIHFAKTTDKKESHRRECLKYFRMEAQRQNENVYIYGMTATPVINDISEARSLVELITGKEHPEIGDSNTVQNCYQANKWLTIIGFRYIPDYNINVEHNFIDIMVKEDVLKGYENRKYLEIESRLLDVKLNDANVINEFTKGAIIYCEYKTGIIDKIEDKLNELNISFVKYTGNETTKERDENKEKFKNGEAYILLATKPVATGVDGLQHISNKIIILSYPWTGADYDQLIGRINRKGSIFGKVTIVHPHVFSEQRKYSYDVFRWNKINFKKTIADAVVDGHIDKVCKIDKNQLIKEYFKKCKEGITDFSPERDDLKVNLTFTEYEYKKAESVIKDIHQRANTCKSNTMHSWFTSNNEEWFEYHRQREINKSQWYEDPVDIIAKTICDRNDKNNIIADLGCGMAKLANIIAKEKPEYKVISVDHVAKDDTVIACDIADMSEHIKDDTVDITVFCLSLWGTNYLDYIKEAYRITDKRGLMYICEPVDKFDKDILKSEICKIGFDCFPVHTRGRFNYYTFIKN